MTLWLSAELYISLPSFFPTTPLSLFLGNALWSVIPHLSLVSFFYWHASYDLFLLFLRFSPLLWIQTVVAWAYVCQYIFPLSICKDQLYFPTHSVKPLWKKRMDHSFTVPLFNRLLLLRLRLLLYMQVYFIVFPAKFVVFLSIVVFHYFPFPFFLLLLCKEIEFSSLALIFW